MNSTLAAVMGRAADSGVGLIINPATDDISIINILKIAESCPGVYAGIGFHPNEVHRFSEAEIITELSKYHKHPKVVAIGEIGLDYYHKYSEPAIQIRRLEIQIQFAQAHNLPVILHSREALSDMIQLLEQNYPAHKQSEGKVNGVMHAFEGGYDEAAHLINLGFMIGIGGPVTYKNAIHKHDLARQIALEKIIIETDAPFLSPVPVRGSVNEPGNIKYIAEKLALLRECDIKHIEEKTTSNAINLFQIGDFIAPR